MSKQFKIGDAAIGQRILGPATRKEYVTVAYLRPGTADHAGEKFRVYKYVCRRSSDDKLVTFDRHQYRRGFKMANGMP